MAQAYEENQLIEWPNTLSVWEAVMEKLQSKGNLPNDGAILTTEQSMEQAPGLLDVVNEAIKAYSISDHLYQLLDNAQADLADSVISSIPQDQTDKIVQAARDRLNRDD